MSDLISRQAAIDALDGVKVDEGYCTEYDIGYNDGIDFAVSSLSVLPSAQPERKKGEWDYSDDMYETRVCSACGFDTEDYKEYNYCPNCGAEMEGSDD